MSTLDLTAVDRATDGDRKFFARYPKRTFRVRPAHDGELPGLAMPEVGWSCIAVRQIAPGVRVRIPFVATDLPPNSEAFGAAVFGRLRGA